MITTFTLNKNNGIMRPVIPNLKIIAPSFGSSFTISNHKKINNSHNDQWHYHPEIELVYISEGKGKRQVGNHISYFNDGDLILIGSNLPHCGFNTEETNTKRETVIQMKPDFLGEQFFDTIEMLPIKNMFQKANQGILFGSETKKNIGPRIENLAKQKPLERLTSILAILNDLAQADDNIILHAQKATIETPRQDNERMSVVYNYVKDHFKDTISLEEVANLVSMTAPSFCRYFKKTSNKTFTKFVNDYRLVYASKLLADEPISISDIAYESGFNNFGHFNKSFKEFTGKSASQYRQEIRSYLG